MTEKVVLCPAALRFLLAHRTSEVGAMGEFHGIELDQLILTGPRLSLRAWRADDAGRVEQIMRDGRMFDYLALPNPYTAEDAHRFVCQRGNAGRRTGAGLGSAVIDSRSGQVVGSVELQLTGEPDLGYWIAPDARGRGYAAEATRVLAQWAFAHGLERVQLRCDVRNLASARTALAAGFRYEGTQRDYRQRPPDGARTGAVRDMACFARLGSDPDGRVEPTFPALPPGGLDDAVLTVRAMLPGDAAGFLEQERDPVTVATGFTGTPPEAAAVRRMAARAGLDWLVGQGAPITIADNATGRFAGSIRLRLAGPPGVGGIGYAIHPDFRGRGYTARALRLVIPWALGPGGFARLELGAKRENIASQRAAEAAGFAPDGIRAARLRNPDGSFTDEVRFALVAQTLRRSGE